MRILLALFLPLFSLFASWQEELCQKLAEQRIPDWMTAQIQEDLAPYRNGISTKLLEETEASYHAQCDSLFVRYEISNRKVTAFANPATKKEDRFEAVTKALQQLADCIAIPDQTLLVSLHDSFDSPLNGPLLVFGKNRETAKTNILIPDFEALRGHDKALQEVAQGVKDFPWDKKIKKAFWRGATTGGSFTLSNYKMFPRTQLVSLSRDNPHLIDAGFTGFVQCENEKVKKKLRKFRGKYKSVHDHLQYKYQVLVDGNTCAYSRAIWQLFSNCVIFKQESPNIQWYYGALQPYIHYIPVANNLSDLVEKISWAQNHDLEIFRIMLRARDFALQNLQQSDTFLYLYLLLTEMGRLAAPDNSSQESATLSAVES
jgi:hypothetical protein